MKNFTIILSIFFVLFLIATLFVASPLPLFLTIFLAFILVFICLGLYLGWRGIAAALLYIILPFLIEYLFYKFKLPLFEQPLIKNLTFNNITLPITLTTLFNIFTLPLAFMAATFFAQKAKLFFNINNYQKTFLTLVSSFLIALNFLKVSGNVIVFGNFFKWLIIALITYALIIRLYQFKAEAADLYKELPIIIFLSIYGINALRNLDSFNLIISAILVVFYLLILFNEYKFKKLGQQF